MGITEEQFWFMNPRKLKPYIKAYQIEQKQIDEYAWIMGAYVYEAVSTVMANVFSKHGTHKYRQVPFLQEVNSGVSESDKPVNRPLTSEEKKKYTEQLFLALSVMQANFNIKKQIEAENE